MKQKLPGYPAAPVTIAERPWSVTYTTVPPIWVPWRRVHAGSFTVGADDVTGIDNRADGVHIECGPDRIIIARTNGWITKERA